ncbi:MAG: CRTAC1 family protein [Caldilineae bacterium]|nr:CRTAC1 family protein [Caldilineae bacterium]
MTQRKQPTRGARASRPARETRDGRKRGAIPPRAFAGGGIALLALLGIGLWLLLGRSPGAGIPSQPSEPLAPTPAEAGVGNGDSDLAALCQDLRAGRHPELGRQPLRDLEARYAELQALPADAGGPRDLELGQVALALAEEMVSQDQLPGAFAHFDEGRALLARVTQPPESVRRGLAELDYREAAAWLRAGETANCNAGDNPQVCLLFRGPDGVYVDQAPSLAAIELLQADLDRRPEHLGARWLLNLAYITLGLYPEGLPERWLIPAEAFGTDSSVPRMVDVGRQLGVAPTTLLGGAVMDDLDGDGLLDLFTTSYEPCSPARFFRNLGDGRFEDRSTAAGLEGQLGGFNVQQTDFDNDGDLDLYITRGAWQHNLGQQRNSLLRNEGEGFFRDVTQAAGLASPAYPTQASAWADYDGDGDLDLFVGNEAGDGTRTFPSQLFRNQGDGSFVDVAAEAGVRNDQMAKGVTWGDYDNDGDPDLFVSNIGPNRLYQNQGDGSFVDRAPELGLLQPGRSFATWFWDYDNDGWLDLYVAGYQASVDEVVADYLGRPNEGLRPKLYHNDGRGGFEDVTLAAGLHQVRLPMGANFGDVDNDGWPDIYLGTGEPDLAAVFPNVLYHNQGGERFADATAASGLGHLPKGHGVAFGDIDNDGDQDLYLQAGGFVPGDASPNALFENPGAGGHWLTLRLVGRRVNRPAIMARIRVDLVEAGAPRSVQALVSSGGSFGANSLQQEIGLGQAERITGLAVWWPGASGWQDYPPIALDRSYRLEEEAAAAEPFERPRLVLDGSPGDG